MKAEETIDFNIKVCWHAISRMYNVQAAKHDITTSIGFVLLNIDPELGTPATKIAPLLGLEARSLTRILKSMEDRGLISKATDPTDGRLVRIFLTPLGSEKREVSRLTVRQFNKKMRELLTEEEVNHFLSTVRKISAAIESKSIF